jgi:beta-phosphoglucomutase
VIRACIFDLDGVIVDTAHYHYLAWKRLANELGIDLTAEHNEKLKGVSRMESLDIILDLGRIELEFDQKLDLTEKKNSWFVEYINEIKPDEIFPGVRSLLQSLRENRLKVALASSSRNAKRVIQLLDIEDEFDVLVDGTMTAKSKPDPEIFLLAAQLLGIPPSECLVFEDAAAGVEAAKRAGMRCVGIGLEDNLKNADIVINTTGDFSIRNLEKI